ncbi:uncharacterized protein NDAI_0J01160 [Naumovozyma dairenensis CBS 421]|uniref:Uncharacterized protein n=1 Tax=Naumovozyma dairenensis (strain ATCC 10597 / BCRC 20456 / CBS 421 / NBRC 0211 / NRRL Y-12639) TaxID=1071378 RepID=G0WGT0_NAUDC|nr:hypothetical protein NDAI_0J01160 [Naumovozyma dairenensis CBS 421]CCD27008.1 hypothetical protein NDAI_0J01160 [Naumovozyma dairenensis CBS 421]
MLNTTDPGIDATSQLLKVQSVLLSKQVVFKDWGLFLNNCCFGIAVRFSKMNVLVQWTGLD